MRKMPVPGFSISLICPYLTRVVGVLHQLGHPCVADEDGLLLGVVFLRLEALLGGFSNDLLHILLLKSTKNAEEEFTLRKLS